MAIIDERKPFIVGSSKVVAFPKNWTTLRNKVIVAMDRVGLIVPKNTTPEEIRRDVEKILDALEEVWSEVEGS